MSEHRVISELTVVLRSKPGGPVLDERATGYEVTLAGFEVLTQLELKTGESVAFELELYDAERANGEARVGWTRRDSFAFRAGLEIVKMAGADKRKLKRLLQPHEADWERLAERLFFVLFLVVVTLAARQLLEEHRPLLGVLVKLGPRAGALFLLGWSFLGMVRRH